MSDINKITDEKVRQLAATLRSSGLAASETEAIRMATSMTQTDSKVSKNFDERKERSTMGLSHLNKQYPKKEESVEKGPEQEKKENQNETIQEAPKSELRADMPIEEAAMLEKDQPTTQTQQETSSEEPQQEINQEPEEEKCCSDCNDCDCSKEEHPEIRIEHDDDEEFIIQDTFSQEAASKEESDKEKEQGNSESDNKQETEPEEKQGPKTPERKPKKDISEMEESRVDLGSVFNFNK